MGEAKGVHDVVGRLARVLKTARLPKAAQKNGQLNQHCVTPKCSSSSSPSSNWYSQESSSTLEPNNSKGSYTNLLNTPLDSIDFKTPSCSTALPKDINVESTISRIRRNPLASFEADYSANHQHSFSDSKTTELNHGAMIQSKSPSAPSYESRYQLLMVDGVLIKIPWHLRASATHFPLVIGSETYVLPYQNNGKKIVVCLNIILAAGQHVVAKVVGYGSFDPETEYPEGAILTIDDEVIASEWQDSTYPCLVTDLASARGHTQDDFTYNAELNGEDSDISTDIEDQQTITCTDLIGTVVRLPGIHGPGLISYELNDSFSTASFYSWSTSMVGGETVTFDLALEGKTQKNRAVRLKLAPLGANLKNSKITKTRKKYLIKKPNLKSFEKDLPLIKTPPTTISELSFTKKGMIGLIDEQPTKTQKGQIKFYIDRTFCKAEFTNSCITGGGGRSPNKKSSLIDLAVVKFDLVVWFRPDVCYQAVNVRPAPKTVPVGCYDSHGFILECSVVQKPWSLHDFRHLMIILSECGPKKAYDWKSIGLELRKSQQDIKNFLNMFIQRIIDSTSDNTEKSTFGKKLEPFIRSLSKPVMGVSADIASPCTKVNGRQAKGKENDSKMTNGVSKAATKSTKSKKTSKTASSTPISAVDSLTNAAETQSTKHKMVIPSFFSSHQRFVARNLLSWEQIPEVSGERAVNSVLGDVMTSCGDHVTTQPTPSSNKKAGNVNYGKLYRYIGVMLGSEVDGNKLPKLSVDEAKVMLYLVNDLFDDISKRNLHSHKQFLLARFFDFTGGKVSGRNPINPYKIKGTLLHLPDKRTNTE